MKRMYLFSVILFMGLVAMAQGVCAQDTEAEIRSVADYILEHTSYEMDGDDPESQYNNWEYENGVMNIAMIRLGRALGEDKYIEFAKKNVAFGFEHQDKLNIFDIHTLDDCGALGASVVDVYKMEANADYRKFIDATADHISNHQQRLLDGTFCRPSPHEMTLWVDDLFMSVPFLARMGALTGDETYFDDAAHQIIQFTDYLFDENKGLHYHFYYSDVQKPGVAYWGRGNGWAMMAQVELLSLLPEDHPERDRLISILHDFILGVSRYQSESGLWHQLLDKTNSYLETSCTAMFTFSVAKAVNEGWIPPRYGTIAIEGMKGLAMKIRDDGQVESTCRGTSTRDYLGHYYRRPAPLNDIHGLGPVLMAGAEVIRLQEQHTFKD